jgi:transcriptional regulator with XRE-family HTH domain
MSLFSKNLRFLRKQRQLNQDEIARLFNKRANTIGNWENQKSEPSLAELMKLGDYFNISLHDLLHADLEMQNFPVSTNHTIPKEKVPAEYVIQDPANTVANEAGNDSFWLILRELRAVNEKLDILSAAIHSANKNPIDKSNH